MNSLKLSAALMVVLQSVSLACSIETKETGADSDTDTGTPDPCDSGWEYTLRADRVDSTVDGDLVAVAGVTPQLSVALTADGQLLVPGAGSVFGPIEQPMTATLRQVAMARIECPELEACADPVAVAVGDGGAALRSEDGGKTWSSLDVGTTADLRGVALVNLRMPDESRKFVGVIVGDGVLLRSDDLGVTWTPVTLDPEQNGSFRAVEGGVSRLVAVGDGGRAIASEDGGATWSSLKTETTADLRRLVFEQDLVVVVTSAGEVVSETSKNAFKTTVAGQPVVDIGSLTGLGLLALYSDKQIAPWPEGSPLAQGGELSSVPRAMSRGGSDIVVGDAGVINYIRADGQEGCGAEGIGRPFIVAGEALAAAVVGRDDWCAPLAVEVDGLDAARRERLAQAWARDAAAEHASVAAFARWIVELLACAAPPALVSSAQAAIADEIEHARLCYGLAAAYGGRPVGPGALPVARSVAVSSDMSELAWSTFVEGCVGETIAAVEAGYAAALCVDPAVAQVLRTIAADERRHAALAWQALAWALERGGEVVRRRVEAALAGLRAPRVVEDAGDRRRGRLGALERRELAEATLRGVIVPSARRLLARVVRRDEGVVTELAAQA